MDNGTRTSLSGEFAEFVAPGRCPCCGRVPGLWTPAAIVEAIQAWTVANGRAPTSEDWWKARPGQPTAQQVYQVFGSFKRAREAAGVTFRRWNHAGDWTREQVFDAFARWRFLHGRLPLKREWANPPEGFPSAYRVETLFGTWTGALVACGWEPNRRVRSDKSYAASMAAVTKRGVAA